MLRLIPVKPSSNTECRLQLQIGLLYSADWEAVFSLPSKTSAGLNAQSIVQNTSGRFIIEGIFRLGIQSYHKNSAVIFPELQRLARDKEISIIAIPVAAAVERLFSRAEMMLSKWRRKSKPQITNLYSCKHKAASQK